MKISASLYANPQRSVLDLAQDLDQYAVDYFHIDCKDQVEVFQDIAAIQQLSPTPVDLHVITQEPQKFLDYLAAHPPAFVAYQYEALTDVSGLPTQTNYAQGLAITSQTPIEVFDEVSDRCQFILFMTTVPGESGGKFRRENFQRIRAFMKRYPGIRVHVDGGVNAEVGFILRNMGVSLVVSGSYLVKSSSIGSSMLQLKSEAVDSHYQVGDFMMGLEETPILKENSATFLEALKTIEQFRHGLVILTGSDGKLKGLITNADVRRGLLRHPQDLNQVKVSDIINPEPLCAYTEETVSQLLQKIKQAPFPVNYLPVLDSSNKVVGLVAFYNLIKGEG